MKHLELKIEKKISVPQGGKLVLSKEDHRHPKGNCCGDCKNNGNCSSLKKMKEIEDKIKVQ